MLYCHSRVLSDSNDIEETEELNEVFSIERNSKSYTIVLLDSTLHYDIETQAITGSDSSRA